MGKFIPRLSHEWSSSIRYAPLLSAEGIQFSLIDRGGKSKEETAI